MLPALVVDFTLNRLPADTGRLRMWLTAVGGGVAAIAVLGVVQWFFAAFMLTEHARNFFFAGDLWDYYIPPGTSSTNSGAVRWPRGMRVG